MKIERNASVELDRRWAERLDEVLAGVSGDIRSAMRLRYGFGGGAPMTLSEVGRRANRTRERMRQLEVEWKSFCRSLKLDSLDYDFLDVLESMLPATESEVTGALIEYGWLCAPWGIKGIKTIYSYLGLNLGWHPITPQGAMGPTWVNEPGLEALPSAGVVDSMVRQAMAGEDIMPAEEAFEEVAARIESALRINYKTAQLLVAATPSLIIDLPYVIRLPESTSRSRFHNSSQVTLGACGELVDLELWEGIERRYAARGASPVGIDAARAIWRNHSDYRVSGNMVSLSDSASPRPPSRAEKIALELFATKECVSRAEFVAYLTGRGVPVATATTTLSFSSVIEPTPGARGWWRKRGSSADAGSNPRSGAKGSSSVTVEVLPDGVVAMSFKMTPQTTGLAYLPANESRDIRGRRFSVVADDGSPDGLRLPGRSLVVNSSGASWGYRAIWTAVNRIHHLPDTCVCRVLFDTGASEARISFAA
jgi:hypothetical protein